jgi:hypothetical protein
MNSAKDIFETAYLETIYVLTAPDAIFELKIGEFHADFDAWLSQKSITTWVKMTAANPYSRELSVEENNERNHLLRNDLIALGYHTLYGSEGKPPHSEWQPEPGFFIPNIQLSKAIVLAQKYEQNAILYGYWHGVPQLIWAV